jgi:hypothetical protein
MTEPATTPYVLTVVDTTSIQDYIFGSNRLRENIGASQQVHYAMSSYVARALKIVFHESHDLDNLSNETPIEDNPEQHCEVIYAGGGNVLLLSRTEDEQAAKAVVRELSLLLHTNAPGLNIAVAHLPFDWESEYLGDKDTKFGKVVQLYAGLARAKQYRPPAAPLYSPGVTLACPSTGLPAIAEEPDPPDPNRTPFVSASTLGKLQAYPNADERLKQILLEDTVLKEYAIPNQLDNLGRTRDEQSYIAVVHIDGNGMGKRFEEAGKNKTNREYITAVRNLSQHVNEAALTALKRTIDAMMTCFREGQGSSSAQYLWYREKDRLLQSLSRDEKSRKPFLPFRPLVFGGDDVTFVCDGRLGLALAHRFLTEFEQATAGWPDGAVHACAGIAIVKSHFPFARAYEQAADLCQNAKKSLRKAGLANTYSALDWHIAASGRDDSIRDIRAREYKLPNGELLTARPVLLGSATTLTTDWHARTWEQLTQTVDTLNYDTNWNERHNKILALRDVLRQGEAAVEQFKNRYDIGDLPHTSHAVLFDAIETMEFLLPLEPPVKEEEGHIYA